MRFTHSGKDDLSSLLRDGNYPRLLDTDCGSYTIEKFSEDLLGFNDDRTISPNRQASVATSGESMKWLASRDVIFEPI